MPRVPRPEEMPRAALDPAHNPAQINVGVAARIGQAGKAMGNAIESIGSAFGEVAGRIGQASDNSNHANAQLEWLKGDAAIQDDIKANVGEDGALWQDAPKRYEQLNADIAQRYPIGDAAKRSSYNQWAQKSTLQRGWSAARSYQGAARDQFVKGFDQDVAGFEDRIGRGEIDPTTFSDHYGALTSKIQSMDRTVMSQSDVQAKTRELQGRLVGAIDRHLAQKNPEERQNFWNQVREGKYELDQPGFSGQDKPQGFAPSSGAGPDYRGKGGPAAIRYNNPGAMWPGPSSKRFGAVESVTLNDHQRNKIAVFPDAVSGAAAQFDLLERKYTGKTIATAIRTWSGGNSSDAYAVKVAAETGLTPSTVLTRDMIRDPKIAVPIARSMASMEAGRKAYPLDDGQWAQAHQMAFGGGAPVKIASSGADSSGQTATDAGPPANDNSGGEPSPAIESPLGNHAELIAQAVAKDPNAKLSSVVSSEQMAELSARIPGLENAPADSMTVGDLADLAKQSQGQAASAGGAGAQPAQPGYAPPIPMGRLVPGQTFTVKTQNGEIKVPSEWLNAISDKQRAAFVKRAGEDYRMFERGRTSVANGMVEDGEVNVALHGKPHDGYDAATVRAAYAKNPEALRKHAQRMSVAKSVHDETANFANMPSDEIAMRMGELENKYLAEGSTDAGTKKIMDLVTKKTDALLKQRDRDPAGSVEGSQEVRSVREKLIGGAPRNKLDALALMDARMQAQTRLDIPEQQRSPISQREAMALAPSLRGLSPGDALESIQKLHDKVKGQYGEKYSGLIVNKVIETTIREKQKRESFGAMLRELDEDGKVSPVTVERMRNLDELGRREREIAPVAQPKQQKPGVMQRLYDMLPSKDAVRSMTSGAGLGVDEETPVAAKVYPRPSAEHIARLKKMPQSIDQFDAVFGPGSAEKAIPGLQRMLKLQGTSAK